MGRLAVLLATVLIAVGAAAPATAMTRDPAGGTAVVGTAATATATIPTTTATVATRVLLDGVGVALPAGSSQVVTVNHSRDTRARVSLWQHDATGWRLVARTRAGHTGYGGLVLARLRKQATGTTPLGTFGLLSSFGTHARDAGWRLDHRTIRPGDYWVEDNRSAYYNRYRNKAQGGFRWWLAQSRPNSSERLRDFPTQYEYAIVTGFNYDVPVRHRGAGIFLHVNGKGATAGCVSAPRWFLRRTLATLDPSQAPVIAIGR